MNGHCSPHQLVRKNELRVGPNLRSYDRFVCETCGFAVWLYVKDVPNAQL